MTVGEQLDEILNGNSTAINESTIRLNNAVNSLRNLTDTVNQNGTDLDTLTGNVSTLAQTVVQHDTSITDHEERIHVLEERPTGGTGAINGVGGYGPNYICGPNVPDSIKDAVRAGKGVVSDGTNDHTDVQSQMNTFGQTVAIGQFPGMSGTVLPPQRRSLVGWNTYTEFVAAKGLSGSMFLVNTDHVHLSNFAVVGNNGRADTETWKGEAAGTHGIVVDNQSKTSPSTFWTGSESTVFIHHVVVKNVKGDGLRMTGSFNRDSKVEEMHIYNPGGNGVYVACPDGMMSKITVGSPSGYGFWIDKASNWEFGLLKAWYCEKDGFLLDAVRCNFTSLQAQDNRWAGARLLNGVESQLTGFSADSNSLNSANPTPGVHSGLELGVNPASIVNGVWTPGSGSGGTDWVIDGVRAYDKNEGQRGFNQRYGVLVGSVTGVIMTNVHTGRAGGTHRNQTDGVRFLNTSTRTNASNYFGAIFSGGVAA